MTTKTSSRIPWTAEDTAYVLASYPAQPVEQIAEHLHRTKSTVWYHVSRLQREGKLLHANGTRDITTDEQKQQLRDLILGIVTFQNVATGAMIDNHPSLIGYTGGDVTTAVWTLISEGVIALGKNRSLSLRVTAQ